MNLQRTWIPVFALGLAAGWGSQEPQVAELEKRVAETEKGLLEVQKYIQAQVTAAKALRTALEKAEEEGFTAGINYTSRETLLEAWRAEIDAATKDTPGGAKVKAQEDKKKRRR